MESGIATYYSTFANEISDLRATAPHSVIAQPSAHIFDRSGRSRVSVGRFSVVVCSIDLRAVRVASVQSVPVADDRRAVRWREVRRILGGRVLRESRPLPVLTRRYPCAIAACRLA